MKPVSGTGKYEALLEKCRNLEPAPTAVAHPAGRALGAFAIGVVVGVAVIVSVILLMILMS